MPLSFSIGFFGFDEGFRHAATPLAAAFSWLFFSSIFTLSRHFRQLPLLFSPLLSFSPSYFSMIAFSFRFDIIITCFRLFSASPPPISAAFSFFDTAAASSADDFRQLSPPYFSSADDAAFDYTADEGLLLPLPLSF
jgi:hypothetical protein